MNYELVFRSRYGTLTTATIVVLGLLFTGMIWGSDGAQAALRALPIPVALGYFTWWMWAFPTVDASRRGIQVRNQIRTYQIPWGDFQEAESNYGLYLKLVPNTSGGADSTGYSEPKRIYCAGVPARGGLSSSRQKTALAVPELYFEPGPKVCLRVEPPVAVQMLDAEKLYFDNPSQRPPSNRVSDAQVEAWEHRGALKKLLYGTPATGQAADAEGHDAAASVRVNWLQLGILAVLAAAALLTGILA